MTIYRLHSLSGTMISLALVMLLAGCASSPEWPEQSVADSHTDIHQRTILHSVPFYPQERYQCGPASLAMMLNTRGLNTDPDILKELVYLPERKGSLRVELVAGARSHGMLVYELDGTLESLLSEVAAGNPVLVMQNLGFDWWPQWHFAVVIGFDPEARRIILHTDTRERHEQSLTVFTSTWNRAEHWSAVVMKPDQLPATAKPLDYLMAANDLETTGHTFAAMTAYQTAEARWPDQPAAVMGQGNIAYSQTDWAAAIEHYQRMTERFPEVAPGWYNLSQALDQADCPFGAREAADCAATLAPGRFDAPSEHGRNASLSDNNECPVIRCPKPINQ
ncbi:MAG: PA2778 family cysteine peptidase [Marinobacter sp.]|nr:PA2778 family cysteine peptidase [Marinobacter sp.]